jgi:hypothetical protein
MTDYACTRLNNDNKQYWDAELFWNFVPLYTINKLPCTTQNDTEVIKPIYAYM